MFGRATIRLGIGPHSSWFLNFGLKLLAATRLHIAILQYFRNVAKTIDKIETFENGI